MYERAIVLSWNHHHNTNSCVPFFLSFCNSVDRELDEEKDVIWGQAQRQKQTKANSKYESLLDETAPRYNAAKRKEKRPIAEEMVASLGLTFVHLKDGRVCEELGKDRVVKKTMEELGGKGKEHFKEPPVPSNAGETAIGHSAPSYTNDNSSDLGIIKQLLGNIEGKLDSNHDELRLILKEHKEKIDHLEGTVSEQDRVINDKDRVITELRERIDHLEKTVNALSSNQQIIMRVNDKENKRGANINALREVQQDDPTSGSKQRKIRNRDDDDVSELEDETMSC